ncbi:ABC transporter ATP-binding protein [Beijerinckia sp. L45]|uniref:ABC transporter ATP-binding protein n=1 Tax=Beijerinckia sp. L45 TaxID=1641855 RepID=UPI00131D7DF7|nr:ABC transporter ATP-binding protein [Beijerinckia sp. L45]
MLAPAQPGVLPATVPLLTMRDVGKTYNIRGKRTSAVDNLSLDVAPGEFVSIVGPSGCGKSTLMMMASGLIHSSSGEIHIKQSRITAPHVDIGIVFQRDALLDWRTVLENILLQIDVRRLKRGDYRERAVAMLASVGLAGFENAYPRELSGGMRQRVSLCRALIHNPSLILMDEPFGALDAMTREQMNLDLQKLWIQNKTTMLFITHSIWESVFLSDRVIIMSPRPGRIAAEIQIDLPRPRKLAVRESAEFGAYSAKIREKFQSFGLLAEDDQ